MATRFELVIQGDDDASRLRAAGESALNEITRLEALLSYFDSRSLVSRINQHAGQSPVKVPPAITALLRQMAKMHSVSGGAFDPTVAPLMNVWGLMGRPMPHPSAAELVEVRAVVGFPKIDIDDARHTVCLPRTGMSLDLGGIGKGYAIDEAMRTLQDLGVGRALLHGGTSTVYGLGSPYDADAWRIAIPSPNMAADGQDDEAVLAVVALRDEALSVSAVWGKQVVIDGTTYGHILDPRTGHPVSSALMSAVCHPSATATDALATALLVLGTPGLAVLSGKVPALRGLVVAPRVTAGGYRTVQHALPLRV